jgi:cysteine desulfurase
MAYFDNNATTKPFPSVQSAYAEALRESWANPSSPNRSSARVRAKLNGVREDIACSFGTSSDSITFTSGATEANNSIFAHAARSAEPDSQALISSLEHPSVSESARYWFSDRVQTIPAEPSGLIDLDRFSSLLDKLPSLKIVSLMAANNETGVLQPWLETAELCRKRGIKFHCDATQWVGKLPLDDLAVCSSLSASAHKFGGPKGVGFLASEEAHPFVFGGSQENGRRGGTENYPGIEAMRVAWHWVNARLPEFSQRSSWRDSFEETMLKSFPDMKILGFAVPRLWNTSTFVMPDYENLRYVGKLDKLGFEVSTGSACSSGLSKLSSIPLAMGFSEAETKRLIRVSSYADQSEENWQALASAFAQAREELGRDNSHSSVISL